MGEGLEERKSKEKVDYIGGNALEEDRPEKWGNKDQIRIWRNEGNPRRMDGPSELVEAWDLKS